MDSGTETTSIIDDKPCLPQNVLRGVNLEVLFETYFRIIYSRNHFQDFTIVRTYFAGLIHAYFQPDDDGEEGDSGNYDGEGGDDGNDDGESSSQAEKPESNASTEEAEDQLETDAMNIFCQLKKVIKEPHLLLRPILYRWSDIPLIIKGFNENPPVEKLRKETFAVALDLLAKMIDFGIFQQKPNETLLAKILSDIHQDILNNVANSNAHLCRIDLSTFPWFDYFVADLNSMKRTGTAKEIYTSKINEDYLFKIKCLLKSMERKVAKVHDPNNAASLVSSTEYCLPERMTMDKFVSYIHAANKNELVSLLKNYKMKEGKTADDVDDWRHRYFFDLVGEHLDDNYGSLFVSDEEEAEREKQLIDKHKDKALNPSGKADASLAWQKCLMGMTKAYRNIKESTIV